MSRIIKSSNVNILEKSTCIGEVKSEDLEVDIGIQEKKDSNDEYEQILDIAREQAKKLVNDAILEAGTIKDSVIKDAEEQLENIKKDAHDQAYKAGKDEGYSEGNDLGHKEGFQTGFDEGKKESNKLVEQANSIKREYLEEKEKTLNSIEADVFNLVFLLLKRH